MKIGATVLPFFGYYLTRKSDNLPKVLRKYSERQFSRHDYKPTRKDKLVEFGKKIVEFLFPTRVAETPAENQFRNWSYIDQTTVDQLLAGELSYLKINKKELKHLNKLSYSDQIDYALKLEKEGRVIDIKLSDIDKKDIENHYIHPFDTIKKLARKGKLWSKPTIIVNKSTMNLHKKINEEMAQQKLNNAQDVFVKTQPPTQK